MPWAGGLSIGVASSTNARMAERQVRAIVHGVVQGVWFRKSTVEAASRIGGLVGTVRNLPDRTVEIVARGAGDKVEALLAWAHEGPSAARVDRVEVLEMDPVLDAPDFRVVY
jgi:acylphosphatase